MVNFPLEEEKLVRLNESEESPLVGVFNLNQERKEMKPLEPLIQNHPPSWLSLNYFN